jgi:hypothetical protein
MSGVFNEPNNAGNIVGVYWPTEQVTLGAMAIQMSQLRKLFYVFHAFSNNVCSHCGGHCDNRSHNVLSGGFRVDVINEGSVDFDALNWESL